ncbi:hypothetical protein GKZ28_11860 [Clostridium chromiireducens]|uniref:JAB domain-containing protein n=1 Tax=Clostridium chromiireducens TaxID=225345 RepID=A0A964W2C9_9CLOT|nr:Mov34/MPN/PAD-1 family protein [Clostridium chromiireducens]MVX64386.1 hypothetical protein [Clostridium chromiireducens]
MSIIIKNKKTMIKIKDEVLNLISNYKQSKKEDYESGGILIGYETIDGNIIIEFATQPFPNDIRKKNSFERIDSKHNEFLDKLWKENGEIYMYVGEWHTHPEDYPKYSLKDKRNWKNISCNMSPYKEKYIHIIVGNKGIGIWIYETMSKRIYKIY